MTKTKTGAKLKVTRCNGEKCYYTSYTNKNGKNIELDIPELISISSITYDENNTGCIKESEEEPKEETCVNAPQLNIDGKYTFNLCYNSKFDFEEVKDLVKNVVSCKYNRVLDESSIRATGKIVKGKKYNSSDYTVECVLKEKPSVAVESGLVDNSGYGTITVNANSKSGTIVSYYTSESLNAPTKTSKWTKVNDNIFTIKSTPGVVYIWVKDSLGNISDVVSGAVIDTKNTSTTIRTIELKDANGNSLAMKAKTKISYSVSGINNMYTRLSNQKIADNFNPFDMEYELEVDTSTVTVFATLTSNDSKFVEGYGPRTVNLSYGVNTVLIKIQNKEGKIRTYTIIVTRKDSRNADNTLKEITLSEGKIDFNANVTKYKIEIPKNTESVVVSCKYYWKYNSKIN